MSTRSGDVGSKNLAQHGKLPLSLCTHNKAFYVCLISQSFAVVLSNSDNSAERDANCYAMGKKITISIAFES